MEKTTITSAEWEVMRIVWSNPRITSRQIIDTLQPILEWKEGTVKSLLNRLLQKGYLKQDTNHKPALYSASISQEQASQALLLEIMDKNCCRDRGALIKFLLETQALSIEDCQDMMTLLAEKSKTAPTIVQCHCAPGQCTCHHDHHHG